MSACGEFPVLRPGISSSVGAEWKGSGWPFLQAGQSTDQRFSSSGKDRFKLPV